MSNEKDNFQYPAGSDQEGRGRDWNFPELTEKNCKIFRQY